MAGKHPKGADDDGTMIPALRRVIREGRTAAQFSEQNREKTQWFRDRDIDPGDWSKVYPILKSSWKAHGIPSAMERAGQRHAERQR